MPEISEILDHPDFLSMGGFLHHGTVDCLSHSLNVAQRAFFAAVKFDADVVSTLRGALLHDFYLYDWHVDGPPPHGYRHPYAALREAEKRFELNRIERDIIKKHMFPLTPFLPCYKESWIVCIADKFAAVSDYAGLIKQRGSATLT